MSALIVPTDSDYRRRLTELPTRTCRICENASQMRRYFARKAVQRAAV